MADGVWIQHPTARSQVCVIEERDKPYFLSYGAAGVCDGRNGRPHIPAPIIRCHVPGCGMTHHCKVIHLWVNDTGQVMVHKDFLPRIFAAGETGFTVTGHTSTPPTLRIGVPREEVDNDNRRIVQLTPMKPKEPSNG